MKSIIYGVICILPLLFISASAGPANFEIKGPGLAEQKGPGLAEQKGPGIAEQKGPGLAEQKGPGIAEQKGPAIAGTKGLATAETNFPGKWELVTPNSGISAMHLILLPKVNKALMYDATVWRISNITLPPEKMPCRIANPATGEQDCWAHSVLLDYETGQLTPLKIVSDTWCSSGGLTVAGDFVGTGGFRDGANTVRFLDSCEKCDWREYPNALAQPRWYATQVTLPDASAVVFGGRGVYDYEFIPAEKQTNKDAIFLPLLKDTHDRLPNMNPPLPDDSLENNLYPFVHLAPDGNLFIFANNRGILLNPKTNQVVRDYPILPGGARNYPASGMSVLLPLQLVQGKEIVDAEVLICGGAPRDSFYYAEKQKKFLPALQDCGRIQILNPKPVWAIEKMPAPRVMGDMTILPSGDVLMLNGAKTGTSAWNDAEEPYMAPVLYKTTAPEGLRFKELAPSNIARMYHSVAGVLPDGKVLVAGSNTHDGYEYNAKYPTELRVEKFSPPYLDPALAPLRLQIVVDLSDKVLAYGKQFSIKVKSEEKLLNKEDLKVTMYAPPFTTHGISMSQRLVILPVVEVTSTPGVHNIAAGAPMAGTLAPAGYYLLSVVYKGVPSVSMWVQIK
ncbi:aldehyde oxidase GLOX1-like [Mangifera indica]|uniref:aldehyde oxidase GLOX1-like n=1 Tax=Mangifera indica TaxID=29780 RepID=UPI001CF95012|nr:aldehyde oxidase GLOX1-like [Mangifera indica]